MRLLEKSAFVLVITLINNVLAFAVSIILARTMSTVDFGTLQTIYGFSALAFNLINLGVVNATNKFVLHNKDNKLRLRQYVFNGFLIILAISAVFILTSFFMKDFLMSLLQLNPLKENTYVLLIPLTVANLVYYYFTTNLISSGKTLKNALIDLFNVAIYLAPIIILLLINALEVKTVFIIRIFSFAAATIFSILYFYSRKLKFSAEKIRNILSLAKISFISTIIVILMDYLAKPILGLISLEQAAFYSIALTYSQVITIFQSGLKTIIFPLIGSLAVKNMLDSLKKALNILFDLVIKIVLPLSIILIILSDDVIRLFYTSKYDGVSVYVLFTIIGAVINILCLPSSAIFLGLNKLDDNNKYNFLRAVTYLPVLLILILTFSGLGASISYMLLAVINLVFMLIFFVKYKIIVSINKPASILIPLSVFLLFLLTGNKIIPIILSLLYSAASFKLNIVSKQTKDYIIKVFKDRKHFAKLLLLIQ